MSILCSNCLSLMHFAPIHLQFSKLISIYPMNFMDLILLSMELFVLFPIVVTLMSLPLPLSLDFARFTLFHLFATRDFCDLLGGVTWVTSRMIWAPVGLCTLPGQNRADERERDS